MPQPTPAQSSAAVGILVDLARAGRRPTLSIDLAGLCFVFADNRPARCRPAKAIDWRDCDDPAAVDDFTTHALHAIHDNDHPISPPDVGAIETAPAHGRGSV